MTSRIRLVAPDPAFHASWLEAADEFVAEDQRIYTEMVMPADACFAGWQWTVEALAAPEAFAAMCAERIAQESADRPRPCGWTSATTRWIVDDDSFLGSVSFRHALTTEFLREYGGHIGYSVRSSARGRGVASRGLALMLPLAAERGLDRFLLTCDDDNIASATVIERNGGILEDVRDGKRRYWIDR